VERIGDEARSSVEEPAPNPAMAVAAAVAERSAACAGLEIDIRPARRGPSMEEEARADDDGFDGSKSRRASVV